MRINRAIGLALVIIVLQILVRPVFQELEKTIISLLHTSQISLDVMQASVLKVGNSLPVPGVE